jgi:RNA ligase
MDTTLLNSYYVSGKLRKSVHPTLDLTIWNYTDLVQFEKSWDPITLSARALVTNSAGEIIARSFPKFFNFEESRHVSLGFDYNVYKKLDGSLILLFNYLGNWVVSSRGSFVSEQAEKARELLASKNLELLDKSLCWSFEIVYPENRIVVNYAGDTRLVFLAAFDKYGREHLDAINSVINAGFPVVEHVPFDTFENLKAKNIPNEEGYVLRYNVTGERVKIKFETYIKLHRLMSNITVPRIFKWIVTGDTESLAAVPDELYSWVCEIKDEIEKQRLDIFTECKDFLASLPENLSKKDLAHHISDHKYRHILFKIHANMDPSILIYKLINVTELNERFSKQVFYKNNYDAIPNSSDPIVKDTLGPKCVIFDIDGTLAINSSGRSPFDYSVVHLDTLNSDIYQIYKFINENSDVDIILCSGRDESSRELTCLWLEEHDITFTRLYLRGIRCFDPDYLVKERMWREIAGTYQIVSLFDDRNQVVDHARKLGLTVCQVAPGDF